MKLKMILNVNLNLKLSVLKHNLTENLNPKQFEPKNALKTDTESDFKSQ